MVQFGLVCSSNWLGLGANASATACARGWFAARIGWIWIDPIYAKFNLDKIRVRQKFNLDKIQTFAVLFARHFSGELGFC